jgi:hypothetical protein
MMFDAVVAGAGPGAIAAVLAVLERRPTARIAPIGAGHRQSRRSSTVDAA